MRKRPRLSKGGRKCLRSSYRQHNLSPAHHNRFLCLADESDLIAIGVDLGLPFNPKTPDWGACESVRLIGLQFTGSISPFK